MAITLVLAISWFARLITFILMVRVILSWFVRGGNPTVLKIYQVSVTLTEPIVGPCRKLLSRFNTGMFDFSVLLAMVLVDVGASILVRLILYIFR